MKSKSNSLSRILAERIQRGDYDLMGFPNGAELTREFGISRNTAYKVLDLLVDAGLLVKKDNGRMELRRAQDAEERPRRIAFLQPAFSSEHFDMLSGIWRRAVDRAAAEHGVKVRPLIYTDYEDPILREALQAFEAVFFFCMANPVTPRLIELFQANPRRIVALGCDLSQHGIRSVRLCSGQFLHRLLDHLAELGHHHVDCLNVHPTTNSDVEDRIWNWEIWRKAHDVPGKFHNHPVTTPGVPFDSAFQEAHEAVAQLLRTDSLKATAIYCTSLPAALGAIRALTDAGLEAGKDVSVCAASDEGMCRYVSPTLTSIGIPDPAPFLKICLERTMTGRSGWDGPLLIQPDEAELFIGESTGAPAAAVPRSTRSARRETAGRGVRSSQKANQAKEF